MAKGNTKFELTIGDLDRFSKPFQSFAKSVTGSTQKVHDFGLEMKRTKSQISGSLGFDRLGGAFKNFGCSLGQVQGEFANLMGHGKRLISNLGLIGLVADGVGTGLMGLVTSFAKAGDVATKFAQKTSLSIIGWQEYAYAAEASGVSNELLANSFQELNLRALKSLQGNAAQKKAFQGLGLELKNSQGLLKDVDTLFMEVAESLSKMPEGAQKAAAANAIFGMSSKDLLPLLNQGEEGLKNLRREAVNLGLVMDDENTQAAQKFNLSLKKLGGAIQGVGFIFGEAFLPIAQEVISSLTQWVSMNKELIKSKVSQWAQDIAAHLPQIKAKITELIENIPSWLKKSEEFIKKIGGWKTIALGVAAVLVGPLLASILSLIPAFYSLGAAMMATPIGQVIAAIALMAAAVYLIYKNWDEIVYFFKALWEDIKYIFSAALGFLKNKVVDAFHKMVNFISGFITEKTENIKDAFDKGWLQGIISVFLEFDLATMLFAFVNNFIKYFLGVDLKEVGLNWLNTIWDGFKSGWSDFASWVTGKISSLIPGPILKLLSDGNHGNNASFEHTSASTSIGHSSSNLSEGISHIIQTKIERQESTIRLELPPGVMAIPVGGNSENVTIKNYPSYLGIQGAY